MLLSSKISFILIGFEPLHVILNANVAWDEFRTLSDICDGAKSR